jgi:hypothetical protein
MFGTGKIKALAAKADTARRLQTIPGVGSLTARAVEAFAPSVESFLRARPRSAPVLLSRSVVLRRRGRLISADC